MWLRICPARPRAWPLQRLFLAFLGAQLGAAAAAAMSSPARAAAPVLALAAVAAAAGVAMNRYRRAFRASDEDPLLFKSAKYGAASV